MRDNKLMVVFNMVIDLVIIVVAIRQNMFLSAFEYLL